MAQATDGDTRGDTGTNNRAIRTAARAAGSQVQRNARQGGHDGHAGEEEEEDAKRDGGGGAIAAVAAQRGTSDGGTTRGATGGSDVSVDDERMHPSAALDADVAATVLAHLDPSDLAAAATVNRAFGSAAHRVRSQIQVRGTLLSLIGKVIRFAEYPAGDCLGCNALHQWAGTSCESCGAPVEPRDGSFHFDFGWVDGPRPMGDGQGCLTSPRRAARGARLGHTTVVLDD
jgi:hypothetical protein